MIKKQYKWQEIEQTQSSTSKQYKIKIKPPFLRGFRSPGPQVCSSDCKSSSDVRCDVITRCVPVIQDKVYKVNFKQLIHKKLCFVKLVAKVSASQTYLRFSQCSLCRGRLILKILVIYYCFSQIYYCFSQTYYCFSQIYYHITVLAKVSKFSMCTFKIRYIF